jgi:prevent-host-death family protein
MIRLAEPYTYDGVCGHTQPLFTLARRPSSNIKYESYLVLEEEAMLNLDRDIHSLSDFKRKTPEFIEQLEETGEPVVLTINGRAKLIVQDAASYQKMLELLDRAETIEAIREGLESVRQGKTMSLTQFDRGMRKKFRPSKKK